MGNQFLDAWKEGVQMAGPSFFFVLSDDVHSAKSRDQLRPNEELIESALGAMSPGERVFLLSLYQFYNDSTVRLLCEKYEYQFPSLTDIASCDPDRQAVIARLLGSYTGW